MSSFTPIALNVALPLALANAGQNSPACFGEVSPEVQTLVWLVRRENSGGCLARLGSPVPGLRVPWELRSLFRLSHKDSTKQVYFTASDGSRYYHQGLQVSFTMLDGSVYGSTQNQAYAHSADGSYHFYRAGRQITESLQGRDGYYRYQDDGHSATIDDTRDGRNVHFRQQGSGDCQEAP